MAAADIPNFKKVQAAADAFGFVARSDEEAATLFREWLELFVTVVEEDDGRRTVVYNEDAEEQVFEWAAECVMAPLTVEEVRAQMPAEEVQRTLMTIHFMATRLHCDVTHKLTRDEFARVMDVCNRLKGARPMEEVAAKE